MTLTNRFQTHKQKSVKEAKLISMENSKIAQVPNSHQNANKIETAQYFSQAVQLVTSAALPMVLFTAVKLKLFEIIAKAGHGKKLSPAQIASQLPTKNSDAPSMLDRMLLLLSSHSVLTCDVLENACKDGVQYERVYGLAPVGEFFVPDEEGNTIAHLAEMLQDKVKIESWYELGNAVLKGGIPPFDRTHGMPIFEYTGKDARFNEVFNKGLVGLTSTTMKFLLNEYRGFEHLKTLVDVGGGLGVTLYRITSKYPSIQGTNFDLPHVVKDAPSYPGIKHIGGDMFESVPEGEAIFMKGVLHDWSDDHCIKLLKNCLKALPNNGKVIVVDFILPLKPDTSDSSKCVCQTDTLMMTVSTGGKERSEVEFQALATAAGFKGTRSECHAGNVGVIEMFK